MTELDTETKAAIDALVYRLANREEGTDDEPFAMEFVQALLGRGWRPTEAGRSKLRTAKVADATGPTEEWRRIRAERAALEAQRAAQDPGDAA